MYFFARLIDAPAGAFPVPQLLLKNRNLSVRSSKELNSVDICEFNPILQNLKWIVFICLYMKLFFEWRQICVVLDWNLPAASTCRFLFLKQIKLIKSVTLPLVRSTYNEYSFLLKSTFRFKGKALTKKVQKERCSLCFERRLSIFGNFFENERNCAKGIK